MMAPGIYGQVVTQMTNEEAAKARQDLSGKALREHVIKSNEELKKDKAVYREKSKKEHGANKETMATLANMAKNRMHFVELLADWEDGKTGVRKSKLQFEGMQTDEKRMWSETMLRCWRKRPINVEGDMKEACLARFRRLQKESKLPGADTEAILYEIADIQEAVDQLNRWDDASQIDLFFPGRGGNREQQLAEEKVRAIERKDGGPMSNEKKYEDFPCLKPGWPDQLGTKKLGFEYEVDALERKQQQREQQSLSTDSQLESSGQREGAMSPSLRQARLADQALARAELNLKEKNAGRIEGEHMAQGGYEGEDGEVFDAIFCEGSAAGGAPYLPTGSPVSPSLRPADDGPFEEGEEEGEEELVAPAKEYMTEAQPSAKALGKRKLPPTEAEVDDDDGTGAMPAPSQPAASLWNDAFAAGGFNQHTPANSSDADEIDEHEEREAHRKKRRTEIYGLGDMDAEMDDRDSEAENPDY